MASHKGWDYQFPVTSVASSGGSFNLAKGQLALVDLEGVPTANDGLKLIDSLSGFKKNRKLQLRVGKHEIANNRSQSSKDWSSQTFKITDVEYLGVDAPKSGIGVDSFTLGYNGIDADTAIVLKQGENEEIGITLSGEVIGALGYSKAMAEVKLYLDQPNNGDLKTMQEVVETAVKQFNSYKLMGQVPVTNYVKAIAVNSENAPLTGDAKYFYTLTVEDAGDSNALAAVQSQYDTKVVRTDRVGDESIYTIIDVLDASIADFEKNKAWKVKGCATCPAGYTQYTDGYIYSVGIEDDGADSTLAIEAISDNAEVGSAVRVGIEGGFSTYTVVLTAEMTEAELEAFLTANEEAVVSLVSANVADVCAPTNVTTESWVASTDPCYTTTETYTITLQDDKCGDNKLAKLNAAYPNLNVTVDTAGGCKTRYKADVITNLVCDDCSDIYRELFVTEAPQDFGENPWKAEAKTYSPTALMGIKFEAQPIEFYGSEVYRDDMPYFATSARLAISGGHARNVNESFYEGTAGRMALSIDSIASEPENWGGNLWEYEDITKRRQEGVGRHEGNNYAKWILGEETVLKPGVPYVDYILRIRVKKMAQSFSGELNETLNYHFLVEPGKHVEVEKLMNMLAIEAGIDTVQAYALDA